MTTKPQETQQQVSSETEAAKAAQVKAVLEVRLFLCHFEWRVDNALKAKIILLEKELDDMRLSLVDLKVSTLKSSSPSGQYAYPSIAREE